MSILFEKFAVHNQHWSSVKQFSDYDPHLKKLKNLPYVYKSRLLETFPYLTPGIYVIGGGRQIGKSTFLKQSILKLIKAGSIQKENILFLTGEAIYSADELRRLITTFLKDKNGYCTIFIDEINCISDWDKTVKFVADAGLLEKCSLILTGSDIIVIKEAMKRFPGRRGKATQTNFHYYPLSFREYLKLKSSLPSNVMECILQTPYKELESANVIQKHISAIYGELKNYVVTGGYLTAINDLAKENRILTNTFITYWEWIVGDVLKHKKTENYLREILGGILKRYGTQITWNSLTKDLSIDHHKTVSDYCDILSQMDATFIQSALLQDKLVAAPKKAKKIYFTDPFIHHAVHIMISETENPWEDYLNQLVKGDEEMLAPYIEAIVVTHFRRKYKSYYIKNSGEIDLAYIKGKKVFPVEVKWTSRLRQKEMLHISKYPAGIIAAKTDSLSMLGPNMVVPIPILLIKEIE